MKPWYQAAVAGVAVLFMTVPIGGQSAPTELYRAAVASFIEGGDATKSVERMAGLDPAQLASTVKDVIRRTRSTDDEGASFLEAAALLHLEIGVAIVGMSPASAQRHFEFGEQLIDSLVPINADLRELMSERRKADIAYVRSTWCAVAGSAFLAVNDTARARPFLRKAGSISPRNAAALTLQGTADEIDGLFLNTDAWEGSNMRGHIGRERTRLLFAAERWYREALRAEPNYPLALIRLGRVFHLKGFVKDADQWLAKGTESATEPSHKYLAAMFTGALRQDQKNLDAARASFETAVSIAPRSQNAIVALAYVELLSGRANRAQSLARRYLMTPGSAESWWASKNGTLDLVGLQRLRRRVRP